MNLQEFLDKIEPDQLNEMANIAVKRFYVDRMDQHRGKAVFIYGRNARIPSFIFFFQEDTDKAVALNIQSEKLQRAQIDSISGDGDLSRSEIHAVDAIRYRNGDDVYFYTVMNSHLDKYIKNEPKIKTVKDVIRWAKTKTKLSKYNMEEIFGIGGDDVDAAVNDVAVEIYGGAKALYPAGMRESHKTKFGEIWRKAARVLEKHGLSNVVRDTEIRFVDISGTTNGLYFQDDKHLSIDRKGLGKPDNMAMTIIHELGHKHMFEYLSSSAVGDLTKFYNKNIRSLDPVQGRLQAETKDLNKVFKVGDKVKYKGKLKKFTKYGTDWTIQSIHYDKVKLVNDTWVTIGPSSLDSFLSADFEFEELEKVEKYLEKNLSYVVSEKRSKNKVEGIWPSKYGKKNYAEYYAEMFTLYMIGEAGEMITMIMDSLVKNGKFPQELMQ